MRRGQDHYGKLARQQGYAARSVFKLQQMQERFRLIRPGQAILDIGCAPGSWSQYCLQQLGGRGSVTGVDPAAMAGAPGPGFYHVQGSIFDPAVIERCRARGPYDLVLSDAAPETSGSSLVDSQRSLEIARQAVLVARAALRPGGDLVVKVFQGGEEQGLLQAMRRLFGRARAFKPPASRSESREVYFLGFGKKELAPSERAEL